MKLSTSYLLTPIVVFFLTACQTIPDTPSPPPASPTSSVRETATPEPSPTPERLSTPTPEAAAPRRQGVTGGTAILGLLGQPQTLNPITENNAAVRQLTPLLFDSLLRADPATAQLQPNLAQSWEYSANGRQVIFQLPENLTWSDGSPLTAADIADSLQATQHPALLTFSDISAPDDQTLRLTFLTIDCAAVTSLALLPLLPASQILEPAPIGSGPFVVTEWPENRRALSLAQNPNYRGPAPFLDGVLVRFINEDELNIALSEGQFDAVGAIPSGVSLANPGSLIDIAYPAPHVIYIAMNYDPKNGRPLPVQLRQALVAGLDRQAMFNTLLGGDGQLMPASLLPGHWAANQTLSPPAYNPDEARELLAKAGLRDSNGDGWLDRNGNRVELAIRLNGANKLHQRLGWLASSYYRELGLFARAESVPPDSLIDDLFTHDFDLAIFSWPLRPDPDQRLFWHSVENEVGQGLNFVSYNNAEVDDLLENGVAVPGCHTDERLQPYTQLQDILNRERPVDFLLAPHQHLLTSNRLQGVAPGPFAPFTWNITEWFLQE